MNKSTEHFPVPPLERIQILTNYKNQLVKFFTSDYFLMEWEINESKVFGILQEIKALKAEITELKLGSPTN